jgi:hypothetical protein
MGWTKGFDVDGVIGKDVVQLLSGALLNVLVWHGRVSVACLQLVFSCCCSDSSSNDSSDGNGSLGCESGGALAEEITQLAQSEVPAELLQ